MTARRTAIPAPMYVLIADFSSLVIRPPRIGFAMTLIESAISSIRQGGIPLRFIFHIIGGDWGASILPARIVCDWLSQSHGPRIQTGSVLSDDGSRGVYRVRHYGVLYASRRARPHN